MTSVVLSLDGTQVAFIEVPSSGDSNLVLLKWATPSTPQTVTTPQTLTAVANNAYRACTAPCMTKVAFDSAGGGSNVDITSSPFYDYTNDVIYVGDNDGKLQKFVNIFNSGTPALAGSPWPIDIHNNNALSSPVLDSVSGRIFVGSAGGRIKYVNAAGNVVSGNVELGGSIVDPPLVDSSTGRVFWFNGKDANRGSIIQTDISLSNRVTIDVGGTNAGSDMHSGAFDDTYLNSSSSDISGFLYFCGKNTGAVNQPALYRVGFDAAGKMTGAIGGPLNFGTSNSAAECSPITEIANTSDRIFVSVAANGNLTGGATACTGACLYSFVLSSPTTGTATVDSLPSNNSTITVGGVTYTWTSSATCGAGTTCIVRGATTTAAATNLTAAINGTCSANTQCVVPNANVNATAKSASNVTTITNVSSNSLSLSRSSSPAAANITLSTSSISSSFPTNSTAKVPATGGTSGIIVDNISSNTGASQVYYSTLGDSTCGDNPNGSTGCAVQASQALLQ